MSTSAALGAWGERCAESFLTGKNYQTIARNYRTRYGEVDIIAKSGGYIVFVEVKLRKSGRFAAARDYVTPAKQRKITAAAQGWLTAHRTKLQPRFDVVEIYAPDGERTELLEIHHIENAFTADR